MTVAVSCCVDPVDENVRLVGDSVIDAGICTVTEAVALVEPDIAVIVAIPFATAVTRPVEDTVATDALDELHVTLAPLIVAPFWSLTVAEICCVSPKDERLRFVTDSVIEVATGAGGPVGVVPPSPHAASKSTAESRI